MVRSRGVPRSPNRHFQDLTSVGRRCWRTRHFPLPSSQDVEAIKDLATATLRSQLAVPAARDFLKEDPQTLRVGQTLPCRVSSWQRVRTSRPSIGLKTSWPETVRVLDRVSVSSAGQVRRSSVCSSTNRHRCRHHPCTERTVWRSTTPSHLAINQWTRESVKKCRTRPKTWLGTNIEILWKVMRRHARARTKLSHKCTPHNAVIDRKSHQAVTLVSVSDGFLGPQWTYLFSRQHCASHAHALQNNNYRNPPATADRSQVPFRFFPHFFIFPILHHFSFVRFLTFF